MTMPDKTARDDAGGRPCVVIDRDANGDHRILADPGVCVFDRSIHTPDDPLYRYTPSPIPEGWLDQPAGRRPCGRRLRSGTAAPRLF